MKNFSWYILGYVLYLFWSEARLARPPSRKPLPSKSLACDEPPRLRLERLRHMGKFRSLSKKGPLSIIPSGAKDLVRYGDLA